jgi:hypothetical protein
MVQDPQNNSRFEGAAEVIDQPNFQGADVFKLLDRAFQSAMAKNPTDIQESYFVFGGRFVRFRIVGRELHQQILRPFSHLRHTGSIPDKTHLTIDLWDECRTKIRCQAHPITGDSKWKQITVQSPDMRYVAQQLPNTLTCLDRTQSRIVGSIAWNSWVFIYERAKPLARLLLEWHNDQGIQIIHGGLVALNGQGVLLVGKSGSGKSTSSLACLCGGLDFLGEDFVGLEITKEGTVIGHSLYNSVFLERNHSKRFEKLNAHVIRGQHSNERKAGVLLSEGFSSRLKRSVPIRALVLPQVNETIVQSRFRSASKGEALLGLGPSCLFQIPSRGAGSFPKLAELAAIVPSYHLELGSDLTSIPSAIGKILSERELPILGSLS